MLGKSGKFTLSPKPVFAGVLPSKLLHGQSNCVQNTSQIDLEDRQIGLFESLARWIIGDELSFTNSCDGVNMIDTPKGLDCLVEGFDLRVPISNIDLSTRGDLSARLIQLFYQLLGAIQVAICDEDSEPGFPAVSVATK